jgi:alpha/beta hydrolase fold.
MSADTAQRLVIVVHGIRTRAEWFSHFRELVESDGSIFVPAGYEFFDAFRFLCPLWTRRRPVRIVLEKIRDALNLHRGRYSEVVMVGHSFGTYIICQVLRNYPDIRADRLLFCGGVVKATFGWPHLPNRPAHVLNEVGSRDIWPVLAKSATWGFGSTGTFGFM